MANIYGKLAKIQAELKSPKDQDAGRYHYRNIEDMNAAIKPLAAKHDCAVYYTDYFVAEDNKPPCCISLCRLVDSDGEKAESQSFAIVNLNPKGMSIEQACASASTFARKAAAAGLFALDNSANDPDKLNADEQPITSDVIEAKRQLWGALIKWAESNGKDAKAEAAEIRARSDYRETRAYLEKVAREYA
jgi:hypothetical protein